MPNTRQMEYNKTYTEKNKEHVNYLKSRTAARSFIRNKANREDLMELKELIAAKEAILNR